MRSNFDKELSELNNEIIEMGSLLELGLSKVIEVIKSYDKEALEIISKSEKQVDNLEMTIQIRALKIIGFQQPVAKDLRSVSAALSIVTDMERISDQTLDIAEIAMNFKGKELIRQPENIIKMIDECIIMVNKSVDAFITKDSALAIEIIKSDAIIDDLFSIVRNNVITIINEDKADGEQAVDFIMITKYLERIADHAVNIAEWIIFINSGEHKDFKLL